jgi:hypothetical protein
MEERRYMCSLRNDKFWWVKQKLKVAFGYKWVASVFSGIRLLSFFQPLAWSLANNTAIFRKC